MTEPTELMPCPFCGGNARKVKHSAGSPGTIGYDRWHGVACAGCNACVGARDRRFRTSAAAIAAWNTRTPQPTKAREIERLRQDAMRYRWLRHGDNDEKVLKTYTSRPSEPGEPTMFLPRNDELDRLIDATPQPTQAQAGAVPLTDEQIEALPLWKPFVGLWPETRREIVRTIERHHGIKGGQHGTE
jgi:Lar family restriction alleviation protein